MGERDSDGRRLLQRSRRRKEAYLAKALRLLDPEELGTLEAAAEILERLTDVPSTPQSGPHVTPVRLTVHRTFHSLGHLENFRRFFIGQAVSVTGTWMQMVAAAWLVLQLTGSGVALGIDTALAFGPILLFGPLGGALADRHDKRRILLATQVTFGVLALGLWAIVATGVVELWMVYVLSFLQGVTTSIDQPTRQSFFSEMVEDRDLPNAVSLNSAVMTGTRIVGPALAGALIAGSGCPGASSSMPSPTSRSSRRSCRCTRRNSGPGAPLARRARSARGSATPGGRMSSGGLSC